MFSSSEKKTSQQIITLLKTIFNNHLVSPHLKNYSENPQQNYGKGIIDILIDKTFNYNHKITKVFTFFKQLKNGRSNTYQGTIWSCDLIS